MRFSWLGHVLLPVVIWITVLTIFCTIIYVFKYDVSVYLPLSFGGQFVGGIDEKPFLYAWNYYLCSWGGNASLSISLYGVKVAKVFVVGESIGGGFRVMVSRTLLGDSAANIVFSLPNPDLYSFKVFVFYVPSSKNVDVRIELVARAPRQGLALNVFVAGVLGAVVWFAVLNAMLLCLGKVERSLLFFYLRFPGLGLLGCASSAVLLYGVWPLKISLGYSPAIVVLHASLIHYDELVRYMLFLLSGLYAILFYAYAGERGQLDLLDLLSLGRVKVFLLHILSWLLLFGLPVVLTVWTLSFSYATLLYLFKPTTALSITTPVVVFELLAYLLAGYLLATTLCIVLRRLNVVVLAYSVSSFAIVQIAHTLFNIYIPLYVTYSSDLSMLYESVAGMPERVEEARITPEILNRVEALYAGYVGKHFLELVAPKILAIAVALTAWLAMLAFIIPRIERR